MKAFLVVFGQNEYVHRVLRSIRVRNDLAGRLGLVSTSSKRRREFRDIRFFSAIFSDTACHPFSAESAHREQMAKQGLGKISSLHHIRKKIFPVKIAKKNSVYLFDFPSC